ncbi:MAG: hypothetical protein JXR97_01370, partial [Planctomycetes bacterium]|nr:hypothetical protein [Planctomycetota bacterium]
MRSKVMALVLAGFLVAGVASANGEMKSELADLKAKVASLESARMAPAAGGDAASLTSMKKKGSIKIGGTVEVDVVAVRRDDMGANADANDEVDSTYFGTGLPYDSGHGAYLDFQINASADTFLYIKLDLDDMWDQAAGQDDLLQEVYFQWNKVRGSNFDVVFGKKSLDYGMDKYVGITPSFNDGWAYWLTAFEDNTGETASNAHNAIGTNNLPTANFNNFQVEGVYHYKDLLNVYVTLFQNNETTGGGRTTRGMHEDRSDDTLFFQSYAL